MNLNINKDQLPLPPALAKIVQTFSVIQRISFPVSSAGIPPERSLGVHLDIPKREERVVCDYIQRNPPLPPLPSPLPAPPLPPPRSKRERRLGTQKVSNKNQDPLVVSIHIK